MEYMENYKKWLTNKYFDDKTREELKSLEGNEKEIEDRFYRELEFGTAGLRGKIGAGTNRMNKYVILRTTQGLADYIKDQGKEYMDRGVAIAFDSRHFSIEFSKYAALVLCGNGIKAYLFESLRPTPELSYTVRHLNTAAGIVVTASHNPREYNGYKVYWEDGAQILPDIADSIVDRIAGIENYESIKIAEEKEAIENGMLKIIGSEIDDIYISKVLGLSLRDDIDKNIRVVYTPLNGTGNIPVRRVLRERGFKNITVVPEQENPDPDFTTVGYPNPEDTRAFKYAESLGKNIGADLLIATDPDCDRLAIMVRNNAGDYLAYNGNQTGAILIKYILEARKEKGTLPKNGAIVKSIVTGDLGRAIAEKYGVATVEALTGFKNICGRAEEFEKKGEYQFIFGYEESIGYVAGNFVRDKDAVISSMLLCEAAAYYKGKGKTLIDILTELYEEFGCYREKQVSLVLEGVEGKERIDRMMAGIRRDYPAGIGGLKLVDYTDYEEGMIHNVLTGERSDSGIPESNVLKFVFNDGSWYAVRPSGTEPKIKIYFYSKGTSIKNAEDKLKAMEDVVIAKLKSVV